MVKLDLFEKLFRKMRFIYVGEALFRAVSPDFDGFIGVYFPSQISLSLAPVLKDLRHGLYILN